MIKLSIIIANILKLFLYAEHAQLQFIKLKLPYEVDIIFILHIRKVGLRKGQ